MRVNRFIFGMFAAVSVLSAQNVTSTVIGSVRDSSSTAVARANVTVTNEGTGIENKTLTGADGEYVVPGLPAGQYTVRIEAPGLKPSVIRGITLLPQRTTRQDVTLEVGSLQQAIEVTASAPVVNTENATIGNVMRGEQISNAPLNGRFLDRLIRGAAGVTTDSASNPRVAGSSYWGGMSFNV